MSLAIRESQNYFPSHSQQNGYDGGGGRNEQMIVRLWGEGNPYTMQTATALCEPVYWFLNKQNIKVPYGPAIQFLARMPGLYVLL